MYVVGVLLYVCVCSGCTIVCMCMQWVYYCMFVYVVGVLLYVCVGSECTIVCLCM